MQIRKHRRSAMLAFTGLISLAAAVPALAQQAKEDETKVKDKSEVETVVVTGTRIKRPNLTSNSPITVIDAEYLQNRGLGRIEDAISTLPQIHPMMGMKTSGETVGAHQINMRRLGAGRTLTLINGVRTINDVGTIPGSLIERVDILTGGASAVYGSDAIGGVVNFITKTRYNGVTVDAEVSAQQHENDNQFMLDLLQKRGYATPKKNFFGGEQYYFNVTAGTDFNDRKGNISGFLGFKETTPIQWSEMDHAACRLTMNQQADYGNYTPPTQLKNDTFDCNFTEYRPYGWFYVNGNEYQLAKDGSKTWVPFDVNDLQRVPIEDYMQRSDKVYHGGIFFNYNFSERLKLNFNVLYTQNKTRSQARRIAVDYVDVNVRCDNSLLSAQQKALLCPTTGGVTPTTAELATAIWRPQADQDFSFGAKTLNAQIGISGRFSDELNYNVSYARYTRDDLYESNHIFIGNFNDRVAEGISGVGASGTCTPQANNPNVDFPNTKCVPGNIYSYDGKGLGDAAYAYYDEAGQTKTTRENQIFVATISGELGKFGLKSPWANDPVAYALSGEYRKDTVTTGGTGGYSWFVAYSGSQDVKEAAVEIDIPLIQDKPLIRDLTLNGGYRLSDYSTHDQIVKTWKAELSWQPTNDVRFRASVNEAFRVAETERLEGIHAYPNVQFRDLCAPPAAGSIYTRYTYEQCSINMTQAQYNALTTDVGYKCDVSGFCNMGTLLNGGRQDLKPETARSYTAGMVFRPTFWRDFTATVDWYSIDITNAFEWVRADQIFTQCYDNRVTTYCDLYKRNATSGRVETVDARWVNAGMTKTKGVDINANYTLRLPEGINGVKVGSFNFGLNGTRTLSNQRKYVAGAPTISCVGYFGSTCGDPWTKWRHTATVNWLTPWEDISVGLNWRYVGETKNDRLSPDKALAAKPNPGNTNLFPLAEKMPARSYFDLALRVPVTKKVEVRFNVQNLLDTEPPLLGEPIGNTFNTYPSFYDAVGRTLRVGMTAKF